MHTNTSREMLSHSSEGTATSSIDCNNKMHEQPYQTLCARHNPATTKASNKYTATSAQQQGPYRQYTHRSSTSLLLLLTQALFLLLLLVSISPTDGKVDWMQRCSMCHCNWNSGKKTADCKARSLNAIPNDLSTEMQVVDFSNNMIPELRREEFVDANLQNLHKIFLRNCTIQELNRDALKGLPILIELDMSHNSIRELRVGTFSGLEKLRTLVMNYNEIEVLENYLFVDLPFLSRVEFTNNRLKQVEVHAFGQQPILSAIFLENNSLQVLRKDTFAGIPKLVHLSLTQNPWNCTCELQAFRDFAIAKRLYTPPTDCAQPAALRGKLWTDIPSDNFACQPHILGSLRSFVEVQYITDNITLPCRVEGSPRPNITWVYNRRAINPNDQRFHIRNSLEQPPLISSDPIESITSEMRIFNVRASDKGVYTCIAENRGGKAEAEFQLIVGGDLFGALEGIAGGVGASTTDTQSNFLLIICLIIITVLLILMCVLLLACWWCRRARSYQKDTTMMSENGLISTKMDKTNSSMLEGSVIMEMQKSLLTEVNPVEKPPRRTELENVDGSDEGHEIKKTLLDESQFGNHPRDDETHSVALSDTTAPRVRHTYIDDTYGTSLPPDLLAFPARVPPTSPSMQSSHSNIPEQIIYGIRSPPLTSPVYAHMTPHGIYGTTTIAAATPNGFMTLQHPKSRNLALIAAANNRQQLQQQQHMHAAAAAAHLPPQHGIHHQQQSPFMPAPVMYSPTTAVVMKQGYMTIPRKPRVPSWAPSTSTANATQLSEFQSPTSPNPSESGTATTAELQVEPVYDNLGLRTTAAGNSTLNLHKIHPEASSGAGGASTSTRYTMRDRPLPATPSLTSVASSSASTAMQQQQQQQQQQQVQQQQHTPTQQKPVLPSTSAAAVVSASKIYEPIHELAHNHHQLTTTSDTEPLYGTARHHNGLTIVPSATNMNGGGGGAVNGALNTSNSTNASITGELTKVAKIPPRPPPKPKKKMSVTATRGGQGSTSQLFDDEGEDGTEV